MLPNLPQTKKKREANFSEKKLDKWLSDNNLRYSTALEIKQTTKQSIPFSEVKDEQLNYLLRIRSNRGVKIRTLGLNGQPDYVWCVNMPSYIVVKYPDCFCIIAPDVWQKESLESKRRSLTLDRARSIATIVV